MTDWDSPRERSSFDPALESFSSKSWYLSEAPERLLLGDNVKLKPIIMKTSYSTPLILASASILVLSACNRDATETDPEPVEAPESGMPATGADTLPAPAPTSPPPVVD